MTLPLGNNDKFTKKFSSKNNFRKDNFPDKGGYTQSRFNKSSVKNSFYKSGERNDFPNRGRSDDRLFNYGNRQQLERDVIHEIRKYLYKTKDLKTWKIAEEDPLSDSSVNELLSDDGSPDSENNKDTEEEMVSSALETLVPTNKQGIPLTNVSETKFDALALPTAIGFTRKRLDKAEESLKLKTNLSGLSANNVRAPSKKIRLKKSVTSAVKNLADDTFKVTPQPTDYGNEEVANRKEIDQLSVAKKATYVDAEGAGIEDSLEQLVYLGEDYVFRLTKTRKRTLARVWVLQNLHAIAIKRVVLLLKKRMEDATSTTSNDEKLNVAAKTIIETGDDKKEEKEEALMIDSSYEVSLAKDFYLSPFVALSSYNVVPLEKLGEKNNTYRFNLFCTVLQNLEKIDEKISDNLMGWRIERLQACKLSLLRLAVAEILEAETPFQVVLNEAIDLAKCLLGPGEHRFVNAILEKIAKAEMKEKQTAEEK